MLHCDNMATFSAVLLSNWVVLPFRKKEKICLTFSYILVDLIEFYKSSICKNVDGRIYFSDDRYYFSEIISQIEIYFPDDTIYFSVSGIFLTYF